MLPVVLDGAGVVLDVGRRQRLATADQRRALRAMYASCFVPECPVPFDHCQVHHITPWTAGRGRTDLGQLVPACTQHHHLIHEGGWTLTLDPDRTLTITRPDGTVHYRGPSVNRAPPQAA